MNVKAQSLGGLQQKNVVASPEKTAHLALKVSASTLSKKWVFSQFDERRALAIAQTYRLPEIVAQVLSARDVPLGHVEDFLEPTLKVQLPNPSDLKDMDKSAKRLADAIMAGEKVAVFGDYDVDGATSTALLKRFFQAVGGQLTVYIPDRMKEGYGPNAPALLKLAEDGHKVIITVDCGITAFEPLAAATAAGVDVIIMDHHASEPKLPDVFAAVNPNRLDEDGKLGHLAAVGVSFLAIVAINRELRARGWYVTRGIAEPRMTQWLDIVALGTVCDVVPLTTVNRAFVAQGLKVMATRQNIGLTALADIAGMDEAPTTFHAGFLLGPRINAGGRVGEADLGTRLLSTNDRGEANDIARALHGYNQERRDIEDEVLAQAMAQVEERIANNNGEVDMVIIAAGDNWHPGVIGIVASRLKEKYNRPACVIGFDDNGVGKASGRSVSGIDLGSMVISARQKEILLAGGGHKMAAGFTVMKDRLEELRAYLHSRVMDSLNGAEFTAELRIDGVLTPSSLNIGLVKRLEMLAPFGQGNAEPRFALTEARIIKPSVIGADQSHLRCFIQDSAGGKSIGGIAFRCMDTPLGEALLKAKDMPMRIKIFPVYKGCLT